MNKSTKYHDEMKALLLPELESSHQECHMNTRKRWREEWLRGIARVTLELKDKQRLYRVVFNCSLQTPSFLPREANSSPPFLCISLRLVSPPTIPSSSPWQDQILHECCKHWKRPWFPSKAEGVLRMKLAVSPQVLSIVCRSHQRPKKGE